MWLKENRENRITCFGGCSSFRGSISLRDFSSCGPNLRAQIGWGRNLVSETRASSYYLENHRAHLSIFTTTGAIGVSETSFPDIEGQLQISPDIAPRRRSRSQNQPLPSGQPLLPQHVFLALPPD